MNVIDDEDRIWKARLAAAPDGWPFDADRDDPLTGRRIAVSGSHPHWCYLVAFDRESEARPDEQETALLVSFLDEWKSRYRDSYRTHMEARPLDVDGGANGVIFHKWAGDDWGYRRRTFERGPRFWPGWPRTRKVGPFSLAAVMDHIYTFGDGPIRHWAEWKAAHPEVFSAGVSS